MTFTPDQEQDWRRAVAKEEAGRDANLAQVRKLEQAERETGFSGDLRRAINAAARRPEHLAEELGVDVALLEGFRSGEATLPSDIVDRLVALLGLRLMAEIPR